MILAYFKRLIWQFFRGIVQIFLVVVLPARLGSSLYTSIDYAMSMARGFSSFVETTLSVYYQDESLNRKSINLKLLNAISLGVVILLLTLVDYTDSLFFTVPILFLAYIYTDIFVRILDVYKSEMASSIVRLLFPLIFVASLYFFKNLLYSALIVCVVPLTLYMLFLKNNIKYVGFRQELILFWRENMFLVLYAIFSLFYAIADRYYIFNYAPRNFAEDFAKLSRVLVLVGFIMSSLTAFLYRDAESIMAKLNSIRLSNILFGCLSILSLTTVALLSLFFTQFYSVDLTILELLSLYLYIPLQVTGVILLTISLRLRDRKKHAIEGVISMIIGFCVELIFFQYELYVQGVIVKMIVTTIVWQILIMRSSSLAISGLRNHVVLVMVLTPLVLAGTDTNVIIIGLYGIQLFWVLFYFGRKLKLESNGK